MNDTFDNLLEGDPFEHLIKILQHSSPKALSNALSDFFEEHILMSLELEKHGININNLLKMKSEYKNEINQGKNDLAINLMANILHQE